MQNMSKIERMFWIATAVMTAVMLLPGVGEYFRASVPLLLRMAIAVFWVIGVMYFSMGRFRRSLRK